MKRIAFLAAVAATLCTVACMVSCNKNDGPDPVLPAQPESQAGQEAEQVSLTVNIGGVGGIMKTKSTSPASREAKILNAQVFVFNDNWLDGYNRVVLDDDPLNPSEPITSISVNCSAGERSVYVLINHPTELNSIVTKTEFLAITSSLSQNSHYNMVMIGNDTFTLPQAEAVTIDVHRLLARVVIKKITRAFTVTAQAAQNFNINEIFMINVAGDTNLGETAAPTNWYNQRAYASEQGSLTHDSLNQTLANNASYATAHYFYVYPNPTVEDSQATIWSPRYTRLVVKATLGSDVYYYPINLPGIESNKSYEIDELILTRPGSDTPDQPVTFQDCSFNINVVGWSTVTVADEGEDDITI